MIPAIPYFLNKTLLLYWLTSFSSVQYSRSVMSDSLRPHGLQQARLPGPSPALGAGVSSSKLLELTQTQVHCVGDAMQPSHPWSSLSPPAFNLSQHQNLFK